MLELLLCSSLTILPDFLYRRFAQGKRIGREITLFSVWYELRWGITLCLILTLSLITTIFYFHPSTSSAVSVFRTVTILPETNGRVAETFVDINQRVTEGQPLFRLDGSEQEAAIETAKRRIAEVEADDGGREVTARRGRGQDRPGARRAAAGAGRIRHPRRTHAAQPRRHLPARGRPGAGRGRHRPGRRRRRRRRQGRGPVADRLPAPGRRRRAPRLRCARPRSNSTRPWSSPAPTASCSSSRCAPATWSTRCCAPPASSCPTATPPASSPASARSRRR